MIQDLRYGMRMLLKHKSFSAILVLTLAFGIGANTAIFSVINALLLRPLPVRDPSELVVLASANRAGPPVVKNPTARIDALSRTVYIFSNHLYEQLRDGSQSLSGIVGVPDSTKNRLRAEGKDTEFIIFQQVTGDFFSVIGVTAAIGRTLTIEDDRAGQPGVAVISHNFWQRRFNSDPAGGKRRAADRSSSRVR